jgi:3-methylcrotonyl-CoA carboxylase alpha subunit
MLSRVQQGRVKFGISVHLRRGFAAPSARTFDKILIANRGEIACRVIKTAQKMGVKTVSVYSDADANSMHVHMADEAYRVGKSPSTESYLLGDKILEVAARSGAQAIHPGYGFLSENAPFAAACETAGVEFVGPPPSAIQVMGSKSESKTIMEAAAVPCVPGYHDESDLTPARLKEEAHKMGFPVMLKAVMGGGGKGMRVVETAEDFDAALESATREALNAFGDDKFLVEKFVVQPRHVEVQVFGDKHGNYVHLFERDCTTQRRHQKVIEEAPGPGIDWTLRTKLGDAAVAAAKAVNYYGAGTVEFIMDKSGEFYFMEMNTRLQVEHPVTEMITGQDLVEWQLRVAAGQTLPKEQSELTINGHSCEGRVYAENPAAGFLPASGLLQHLQAPANSAHVRVETGVREGDSVSTFYDPMISKLVVWAPDRQMALKKLADCLAAYQVVGVPTNIDFLRNLAGHEAFVNFDEVDTGFIEKHYDSLVPAAGEISEEGTTSLLLAAVSLDLVGTPTADAASSPFGNLHNFRLNQKAQRQVKLAVTDELTVEMQLTQHAPNQYGIEYDGNSYCVSASLDAAGNMQAKVDDRHLEARLVHSDNGVHVFRPCGNHMSCSIPQIAALNTANAGLAGLLSPMPGKIVKILVAAGTTVTKGTPIIAMEAMKMEHMISAPADGVVDKILYAVGDQVAEKKSLIDFTVSEE